MKQYKLFYNEHDLCPWYICVRVKPDKGCGFWQQISPHYFRKGNVLRWANKHNIMDMMGI